MSGKKYHRAFVDGCFDICHFGHYNMIRQTSEISDEVVVGIHNDQEIFKNKGCFPVFTLDERVQLVAACKWTTLAVPDAPFTTEIPFMNKYNCEVVIHGDDLVLNSDGVDCYHLIKAAGKFDTVPRTKAISTTNLIQRMLCLESLPSSYTHLKQAHHGPLHSYMPTTHRIAQFANSRGPTKKDKVVYVDGTFDLLHPGHVSFLKNAKVMGDYLVVGVHSDPDLAKIGKQYPIMTLQERVLNVLSVKYVDDVIIGAPYVITKELIDQINPSVVVEGNCSTRADDDAYNIPKERGIYKMIESERSDLTVKNVIKRILDNYQEYAARNEKKMEAEPK